MLKKQSWANKISNVYNVIED